MPPKRYIKQDQDSFYSVHSVALGNTSKDENRQKKNQGPWDPDSKWDAKHKPSSRPQTVKSRNKSYISLATKQIQNWIQKPILGNASISPIREGMLQDWVQIRWSQTVAWIRWLSLCGFVEAWYPSLLKSDRTQSQPNC